MSERSSGVPFTLGLSFSEAVAQENVGRITRNRGGKIKLCELVKINPERIHRASAA